MAAKWGRTALAVLPHFVLDGDGLLGLLVVARLAGAREQQDSAAKDQGAGNVEDTRSGATGERQLKARVGRGLS